MRIPPKKPHFFTIVTPDSQNGALMPISFMCKYLNGEKCEYALLRRGCKKWGVRINDRLFAKGWDKFERDNGLELGDFIVFRHEGHLVFDVLVFDPSLCEKQIPQSSSDIHHDVDQELGIEVERKKNFTEAKTSNKSTTYSHEGSKKKKDEKVMVHDDAKFKPSEHSNSRAFSCTLTRYSIKSSVLHIPAKFARLNGLMNRQCEMILRDEKRRSWPVKLRKKRDQVAEIGLGWRDVCLGNELKQGDEFVLELIQNGKRPIMNFRCLTKKPINATSKSAKNPATLKKMTSADGFHGHFVSTLKKYSIHKSTLYLPMDFARKNGLLTDCEMILKNENQGSWVVELRNMGSYVYIGRGWNAFRVANNLKEGDAFKFELVENETQPIVNFSCMEQPETTVLSGGT